MDYKSPNGLEMKVVQADGMNHQSGRFFYGTMNGLLRLDTFPGIGNCTVVNTVINDNRGNGHFADFMGYMSAFCKRHKTHLLFEHVGGHHRSGLDDSDPKRLARHLKTRGFRNIGGTTHWWLPLYKIK